MLSFQGYNKTNQDFCCVLLRFLTEDLVCQKFYRKVQVVRFTGNPYVDMFPCLSGFQINDRNTATRCKVRMKEPHLISQIAVFRRKKPTSGVEGRMKQTRLINSVGTNAGIRALG